MSYSVSNLFKAIAVNNKIPEGQLENPDIPEFSQAGGVDVKFIRDQAYNSLRLTSAPRNGDGVSSTAFNLLRQSQTRRFSYGWCNRP
jgi:hypothetical protein